MTLSRRRPTLEQLESRIVPNIDINQMWLSDPNNFGPGGSYKLVNQDNNYYDLDTDVMVNGSAFFVQGHDITLDLHGHTITYGNSAPIDVPNGDFELGSGHNVPNWDVTNAPDATLVSTAQIQHDYGPNAMHGNQMLEFQNMPGSAQEYIVSDPITLPLGNYEYTAVVSAKAYRFDGVNATIKVFDIDQNTYLPLGPRGIGEANGNPEGNIGSGSFPKAAFVSPRANARIKLEIHVTASPAGGNIDVDYATVTASRDFGVIAIRYSDLPVQLGPSRTFNDSNFTLTSSGAQGHITQGQGHGYESSPIYYWNQDGFSVNNVAAFANGCDTKVLNGYTANNGVVQFSSFSASIDRLTHRSRINAAIFLGDFGGTALITNDAISGAPQTGIYYDWGNANQMPPQSSLTIQYNTIQLNSLVTNGYGIEITGTQNFEIASNNINASGQPFNGRGIFVDSSGSRVPTLNGKIHDNTAFAYEVPNLEYGKNGLEATALRIRTFASDIGGIQRDLEIYNNVFRAFTDSNGVHEAIGCRLNEVNVTMGPWNNNNADNYIRNNTFSASVVDDGHIPGTGWKDCPYKATAFAITGVDAGTGLRISYNLFESDDTSLHFGDYTDYLDAPHNVTTDIYLVGNTLSLATYGIQYSTNGVYAGVVVGAYRQEISHIHMVNTRLVNGATADFQPADQARGRDPGYVHDNQTPVWETPPLQNRNGNLTVFGLGGSDSQVWSSTFIPNSSGGGAWTNWTLTQPGTFSAITATTDPAGLPELFGISTLDGQVYSATFDAGSDTWNSWSLTQAGLVASAISATTDASGDAVVFAVNRSDQEVYDEIYSGSPPSWSPWAATNGGLTVTGISATPDKNGNLEVFAINSVDSQVYTESSTSSGVWGPWTFTLPEAVNAISILSDAVGNLELFAILQDDPGSNVWVSISTSPGQWSNWAVTQTHAVSAISATLDATGAQNPEVLGIDLTTNQIWIEVSIAGQWTWNNGLPSQNGGFRGVR
jgi:hypothetical protein